MNGQYPYLAAYEEISCKISVFISLQVVDTILI